MSIRINNCGIYNQVWRSHFNIWDIKGAILQCLNPHWDRLFEYAASNLVCLVLSLICNVPSTVWGEAVVLWFHALALNLVRSERRRQLFWQILPEIKSLDVFVKNSRIFDYLFSNTYFGMVKYQSVSEVPRHGVERSNAQEILLAEAQNITNETKSSWNRWCGAVVQGREGVAACTFFPDTSPWRLTHGRIYWTDIRPSKNSLTDTIKHS